MAGVDQFRVLVLANEWAEGSGDNVLSDIVALIGFVMEATQDHGHPVEGHVVAKKAGSEMISSKVM